MRGVFLASGSHLQYFQLSGGGGLFWVLCLVLFGGWPHPCGNICLSSSARNITLTPYIRSPESLPLDRQGSPPETQLLKDRCFKLWFHGGFGLGIVHVCVCVCIISNFPDLKVRIYFLELTSPVLKWCLPFSPRLFFGPQADPEGSLSQFSRWQRRHLLAKKVLSGCEVQASRTPKEGIYYFLLSPTPNEFSSNVQRLEGRGRGIMCQKTWLSLLISSCLFSEWKWKF